jgi:hypothetical protein
VRSTNSTVARRSFFDVSRNRSNSRHRGVARRDATSNRTPNSVNARGTTHISRRGGGIYTGIATRQANTRGVSAVPRSSYSSPTSALPRSYYTAYSGTQNDRGRKDWLDRNSYPNRAFGVGRGLDNRYGSARTGVSRRSAFGRRGSSGKGFAYFGGNNRNGLHGRGYDSGFYGRANAFVKGARLGWKYGKRNGFNSAYSYYDNCYRWPYHLGVSGCRTYGYKGYCYPRYSTSLYLGWGNPWAGYSTGLWSSGYDDYYYDNDTTYVTNNYYDDSANASSTLGNYGTSIPQSSVGSQSPGISQGTNIPVQSMGAHQSNGVQAFTQGDFDLARREFVRAILATPEDPELVMLYGYAHFATGDYLVASLAIRRATEADPTLIERPIDITALYPNRIDVRAASE